MKNADLRGTTVPRRRRHLPQAAKFRLRRAKCRKRSLSKRSRRLFRRLPKFHRTSLRIPTNFSLDLADDLVQRRSAFAQKVTEDG
jgi:hypothetical protein